MATVESEQAAQSEQAASHSGKLLVRMPRTLHADLAAAADREGVSLNALIVGALSGAVAWRSDERPPAVAANGSPPAAPAQPPVAASPAPAAPTAASPAAPALPGPAAPAASARTLTVALVVNLVVVVLAGAAAVALVIAAWPG